MKVGIILKKFRMSQTYSDNGEQIPITILAVEDCEVVGIVRYNGFVALQVGAFKKSKSRVSKSIRVDMEKKGVNVKAIIREFRVSEENILPIAHKISLDMFKIGEKVDVRSKSVGTGFTGVMKRHKFSGGNASHGATKSHRSAGSTGMCQDPGRIFKGRKMAGRSGGKMVTIKNLEVVNICDNHIHLKGSVPGADNGFVLLRHSSWK